MAAITLLPDPEATEALGRQIAAALAPGDAVLLFGELGAGKTTLARGLIRAWTGVEEEAPSPTFALALGYEGPAGPLTHVDLYRLESADDANELGLDEALEQGVVVTEWPERLPGWRPAHRLELRLSVDGAGRRADIAGFGRLAGFGRERG